ncbi:MAG: hypothetical protein IJ760_05490 [Bacteroidales bacterium]|nr:hypothetical protein [Bacteroidales bacterium]
MSQKCNSCGCDGIADEAVFCPWCGKQVCFDAPRVDGALKLVSARLDAARSACAKRQADSLEAQLAKLFSEKG